jgi:serine/threonine protein kinase
VDEALPSEIGGFRLESEIGRGGMGVVYLAAQSFPERKVALKILSPDLARDPSFRARFIRESNAAAAIEHPNIVPVHAAGEDGGRLYLAMRYVEGTDLRSTLARDGALSPERAARICAQIADALEAAHERGLVHRDVKPGNVLLDSREHAYLSDFGLIKPTQTGTEFTKTGQFMGSLEYVAPEQIRGDAIDGRADIYSLGCVLFECLTGRAPFHRENEVATLYAHLEEPAPNPKDARSDVPNSLAAVVERSMSKRPEDRFASASEMGAALRGTSPPSGPLRQRPRALIAGMAVAVIAIVALVAIVASFSGDDEDAASSSPSPSVVADPLAASLAHVDPETGELLSLTPDLQRPEEAFPQVEVGEGSVWILAATKLTQVDPNDGSVVGGITMRGLLPSNSRSLAIGSRTVWVGDVGLVHRVNPATGEELRPVELWGITSSGGLAYVAVGESNAWAVGEDGTLVRIDPLTASKEGSVDVSQSASGIGAGFDAVWVIDDLHGTLTRVDATTLEIVGTYPAPGDMNGIAVGAGAVWLLDSNAGVVTPFHPDTEGFGAPIRVGIGPSDVETGLGSVWVTNQGEDTLSRIDSITGEVETIPIGGPAAAIATDEPTETVWVVLAPASKGGPG